MSIVLNIEPLFYELLRRLIAIPAIMGGKLPIKRHGARTSKTAIITMPGASS